jgi:hypothetical protein
VNDVDSSGGTLRLQGRSLQAALAAGLVLAAATSWAAAVDLGPDMGLNSGPLSVLSILYKLIGIAALIYVGRQMRSRSMWILALLLSLLTLGHFVIDAGWWDDVAHPITQRLEPILHVSSGFINLASMFLALAVIAGGLVWNAYRSASLEERPVVVRLITILFVVGVFVGPVNAISVFGINRLWLFAEDFGQAAALAVLAAYVMGLVVATWERSGSVAPLQKV